MRHIPEPHHPRPRIRSPKGRDEIEPRQFFYRSFITIDVLSDGMLLGWYAVGHHNRAAFLAACRAKLPVPAALEEQLSIERVRYGYWVKTFGPRRFDPELYWPAEPTDPGAEGVTVLYFRQVSAGLTGYVS